MPRRILLIEDNPDDAELTRRRLKGADCEVVTVSSAEEAKSVLKKDRRFQQILYDYGAGGFTEEEKLKSQQAISAFCLKYGIAMVVLSSAKVSPDAIASIERRGATFQTKEVLRGKDETLMRALGLSYLESKEQKDKERSQIIRRVEQTLSQQDFLLNQAQVKVAELSHTIVEQNSRILVLERIVRDLSEQIQDLEQQQKDRFENLEKSFDAFAYEIKHRTNLQVAKWGAIGAVAAAVATAIGAFLVAKK